LIKFKDSLNEKVVSLDQILKNEVIDTELKKKNTKDKNRNEKKDIKEKKEWVTKYLHNPKNVLMLDLASESTGVCVAPNCIIGEYDYIYHAKNKKNDPSNLVERLNYMKNRIIKYIKDNNIDAVAIEALPFKGGKNVLFVLSQIRILILDYCYENDIQYIAVYPLSWENYTWKGRYKDLETKERTLLSLKDDFGIDFKKEFPGKNKSETNKKVWEDPADSYGLGVYVLNKRIKRE
jgi:hypothetical protein